MFFFLFGTENSVGGPINEETNQIKKLDPVGLTTRNEVMNLCTGSVHSSVGQQMVGTWRYVVSPYEVLILCHWVSSGHSCLYILKKVEIWSGDTAP